MRAVDEPTWISLRDTLLSERDSFLTSAPSLAELSSQVHPQALFDWFSDLHEDTQPGLTKAVAYFVEHKKWPALTRNEQAFMLLRLEWAVSLANGISACKGILDPSLDIPEEHMLEWLLIPSWDETGMAQTQVGLDLAAECLDACLAADDDCDCAAEGENEDESEDNPETGAEPEGTE